MPLRTTGLCARAPTRSRGKGAERTLGVAFPGTTSPRRSPRESAWQPQRISARVWTTNGWSANTKVEDVAKFRTCRDQAYPQRRFPAGTRLCAEGFRDGAGVGLPCATITA